MTDTDTRTARRRKVIGGALVAVLAGVLIAIVVVRSAGEKVLNENGDILVLVDQRTGDGMQSLMTGVLTDVGGCLGVTGSQDGTGGGVVVWPHGTTIATPDPLRVRVGGTVYGLGDTIEIGGGSVGPLDETSYFHDKVPEDCRTGDVFVASNG